MPVISTPFGLLTKRDDRHCQLTPTVFVAGSEWYWRKANVAHVNREAQRQERKLRDIMTTRRRYNTGS